MTYERGSGPFHSVDSVRKRTLKVCRQSSREQSEVNCLFSGISGMSSAGNLNIIIGTLQPVLNIFSARQSTLAVTSVTLRIVYFHMMSTNDARHYGEWALSSWYDILPGPDRLLEVSTSLKEDDAWRIVYSWSAKLLTAAVGPEKLQGIADSLVQHHWNQAKRMGCLGIQFTYINGFYHRFIWRSS